MVISHSPGACRAALLSAATPLIIDLETTGIERYDQIVSAGLLISGQIFILFLRAGHASIRNLTPDRFLWALEPLASPGLVTVYHNAPFDLGHLHRAGVKVGGTIHDTLQILRLLDQDRGGDGTDVFRRRRDLRAPAQHWRVSASNQVTGSAGILIPAAPQFTDYKLKHVVPMLTDIEMLDFPGSIAALPYREHVRYLASDLVGTKALYEHLTARLDNNPGLRAYYDRLCAPLTPLLVTMTERGFLADPDAIVAEIDRLGLLIGELEGRHTTAYGAPIGTPSDTARWLFGAKFLRLKPLPGHKVRYGGKWVPSLKAAHLQGLRTQYQGNQVVTGSLALIAAQRRGLDLRAKLGGLLARVEMDSRIHTSLVDRQATGRVTSSNPNLQAIGKESQVGGYLPVFRPRNALVASPGYTLVAFDLAQADIRVLADAVARFPYPTHTHLAQLRRSRYESLVRLDPGFRRLHALRETLKNDQYDPPYQPRPVEFDPQLGSGLARAFQDSTADFYTVASISMLGKPPKDNRERNFCKQSILAIVNGMGPEGLAKRLGCDKETARSYLDKFEQAYPNELAYRRLMAAQIRMTGKVSTFAGRERVDTAHHWLVTQPRIQIKVSYKRGDRYWLDVSPLEPKARVLTCYVHRAWDARPGRYMGQLIYTAPPLDACIQMQAKGGANGCTTNRAYRLYDTTFLEYRLPLRNWGWRSIRRVRPGRGSPGWGEEAQYRGLDAVTRALFNAICQGGTADLTKIQLFSIGSLLTKFGARSLLQIHDELVFEVPVDRVTEFIGAAMPQLAGIVPDFAVPIVLEPKYGSRFGALEWRDVKAILSRRPVRLPSRPSRRARWLMWVGLYI